MKGLEIHRQALGRGLASEAVAGRYGLNSSLVGFNRKETWETLELLTSVE